MLVFANAKMIIIVRLCDIRIKLITLVHVHFTSPILLH